MKTITTKLAPLATSLLLMLSFGAVHADPEADISQLDWMTGTWVGPMGPGTTIEENWTRPDGGAISAMVRIVSEGEVTLYEAITIEEENGTLYFNIQQLEPGFALRGDGQRMVMEEIGENKIWFTKVTEGTFNKVGYSSPEPGLFNIDIVSADGNEFQMNLRAR